MRHHDLPVTTRGVTQGTMIVPPCYVTLLTRYVTPSYAGVTVLREKGI